MDRTGATTARKQLKFKIDILYLEKIQNKIVFGQVNLVFASCKLFGTIELDLSETLLYL